MVSMDFKHFRQEKDKTCGAAVFKQILSILGTEISEKQAVLECKTKKSGTNTYNVKDALVNRIKDREINLVHLNISFKEYYHYLDLLSQSNIVYLSNRYISHSGGRGRNQLRRHACCAFKGMIYDPSESYPVPIQSYFHVFNRDLIVKRIILVDNSGWKI